MCKKILLVLLLAIPVVASAQTSPLDNYVNKTHRQLYNSPTSATPIDTLWWTIGIVVDSAISAIEDFGTDRFLIVSDNYADIATALTTGRSTKRVVVVPVGETGRVTLTSADSLQTIWDFRQRWDNYGTRTWAFKSVSEADSLNRLKKIIDSTGTAGLVKLGRGTWTVASQITLADPYTIEGTSVNRIRDNSVKRQGTILKSSSTTSRDSIGTIGINWQGVNLSRLNFEGNSRLNSNGLYAYRTTSKVGTTMGGYTVSNSSATYNGRSGFNFEGADGCFFYNLEAQYNGRYGIKLTDPEGNGKVSDGTGADGVGNVIISGRTRDNSYGGTHINDTNQTIMIGNQAIRDSTLGVFTQNTSRTTIIGGDYELHVPRAIANGVVTNFKSKKDRQLLMMGTYLGSRHSQGSYTADAGTNTTTIIDAGLPSMPNDYYNGFEVTVGAEEREVTDYVQSTNTLTLASAIVGLTTGSTYALTRDPNRAIHLDSLASGIFINNAGGQDADSMLVVSGYANAIFINPINFDPQTDAKVLGGGSFNHYTIDMDAFGDANPHLYSNSKVIHSVYGAASTDSFLVNTRSSSAGIKLSATGGIIDLQPDAASGSGNVYWNRLVTNNVNPEFRYYFDSNTSASATSRKYVAFSGSGSQNNAMRLVGSDDTVRTVLATPVELSGSAGLARFMDVLASTNAPTPTILTNRVRLYARDDKLWTKDDNGDTLNITPYNYTNTWNPGNLTAGSTDSTTVAVTNAAVGDPVIVGHSGITTANANIQLFGHVVSAGNVRVFARNESGGTYDIPSGTLKIRVWK